MSNSPAPPPAAVACFYTTLRCTAATAQFFGFLPTNGRRMNPGDEFYMPGNVTDFVARLSNRMKNGFLNAVKARALEVVKTPASRFYDPVTDATKIQSLSNGTLSVVDPCEGTYTSAGTHHGPQ